MKPRLFIGALERLGVAVFIAALALIGMPSAGAAVFGGIQTIDLTEEERAFLESPPAWVLELPPEERDMAMVIVRGDELFLPPARLAPRGFTGNKWTSGVVYYQFASNVNTTNRARFRSAAASWANVAALTFVEGVGSGAYINVQDSTQNSSFVGMLGGSQALRMFNWSSEFIIAHEIGHALGLRHEQSRSDRDSYVSIIYGNIESGAEHNFDSQRTTNHTDYDFRSIMHYRRNAFLRSGLSSSNNTIVPQPQYSGFLNVMGNRSELSDDDKAGMAAQYGTTLLLPDLVDGGASFHGLSASSVTIGQQLGISGQVRNIGSDRAGNFAVHFYASTNTGITTSDVYLGSRTIFGLNADTSTAIDTTVTIPAGISSGDYFIGWIIDANSSVAEDDDSNNRVVITNPRIAVSTGLEAADLADSGSGFHTISATTIPAGDYVSVSTEIENAGDANGGEFEVALYLSANSVITAQDIYLGSVTMAAQVPGARRLANITNARIPRNLPAGDYYVGWLIDSTGDVAESNESNNSVLLDDGDTLLTVTESENLIDLRDDGISFQTVSPLVVTAGETLSVTTDVRSAGTGESGDYQIAFYLSDNEFISDSDIALGVLEMGNIDPNSFVTAMLQDATVPASMPPGEYFIGWILDSGRVLEETNETNNEVLYKNGAVKVTVNPPAFPAWVKVTGFDRNADSVELEFQSLAGRQYRIVSSTDLLNWSVVTGQENITGDGGRILRTGLMDSDLPAPDGQRYFRVEEQ